MDKNLISKAMIYAAGRGERLRPLTDTCPKPLLKINGKSILDHILDALVMDGIQDVMMNVSYLGDMIISHFQNLSCPRLHFSMEKERLETGGGTLKVLPFFEDQPFFAINGDTLWSDKTLSPFQLLQNCWDPDKMDILLLMVPVINTHGYEGKGDYHLLSAGQSGPLQYRDLEGYAPYVYGGIQILAPHIFKDYKGDEKFSLKVLYDSAEKEKRLYGIAYDGDWFEIGTIERYQSTQDWFQQIK